MVYYTKQAANNKVICHTVLIYAFVVHLHVYGKNLFSHYVTEASHYNSMYEIVPSDINITISSFAYFSYNPRYCAQHNVIKG